MKLLFGVIFLAIAFFFTHIGMRVLLFKRPYLFPARRSFTMVALAFLPALVHEVKTSWIQYDSGEAVGSSPLQIALLLGLLWFMWTQLKGYMVVGITRVSLHETLHLTLTRLELDFEQKGPILFLPTRQAALHVNVWSWFGTGQLRITPRAGGPLLRNIVEGFPEGFSERGADGFSGDGRRVNLTSAVVYVWAGILNAAVVIVFFSL